jgi:hypothetical protein
LVNILKYTVVIIFLFLSESCKKKTSIEAKVYNYALAEPVANARVVLVERKESGLFVSDISCMEIESATTDAKGNCSFDKKKLKTGAKYTYYLAVAEAYGKSQDFPCGGKTSGFLTAGKAIEQTINLSYFDAYFIVQLNNFLIPSIVNDSFFVSINSPLFLVPGDQHPRGGGVYKSGFQWGGGNPSPIVISEINKTNAGKNTIHIRKRKMGVVTTSIDTVKIYPYETKTIEINW